jgi:hypothetical protein
MLFREVVGGIQGLTANNLSVFGDDDVGVVRCCEVDWQKHDPRTG